MHSQSRLSWLSMSSLSRQKPRALIALAMLGALSLNAVGAGTAVANDAPPVGFPSWEQVQQAKGNASATASEVSKIQTLLDGLSTQADSLGAAAVDAGAEYAVASKSLEEVSARAGKLAAQADRAAKEAKTFQREVAAIAAQNYKSGGTSLGLFSTISALESSESLASLDVLQQLGEQSAAKQFRARDAQAVADSLAKSALGAEAERVRLAAVAKASLEAAESSQRSVIEQLNSKTELSNTLLSQLATLKNTSLAVEQGYRRGQEETAAYNVAQAAKQAAAAAEAARRKAEEAAAPKPGLPPVKPTVPVDPDPDDGFIPIDVLLPNIPGNAVNDPAGAKAYAASRLGAYGWGQDQFQCLSQLWTRESNWLTNATNPYSGAYGIAQSLPPGKYGAAGSDWLTNYRTQIEWGLGYIKDRYGSPCGAWGHSQSVGWY